jgi:hypothetical protein
MESEADCFLNSCEWFARYDHASSSWRTCRRSLLGEWELFAGSWPKAGTILSGIAYRRKCWEQTTNVIGYSSSQLLPTMTVTDAKHPGRVQCKPGRQVSLAMVVNTGLSMRTIKRHGTQYPTPKASDGERGGRGELLALVRGKKTRQQWASPAARDYRSPNKDGRFADQLPNQVGGQLNPTWVEWLMGFPAGWTDLKVSATP